MRWSGCKQQAKPKHDWTHDDRGNLIRVPSVWNVTWVKIVRVTHRPRRVSPCVFDSAVSCMTRATHKGVRVVGGLTQNILLTVCTEFCSTRSSLVICSFPILLPLFSPSPAQTAEDSEFAILPHSTFPGKRALINAH